MSMVVTMPVDWQDRNQTNNQSIYNQPVCPEVKGILTEYVALEEKKADALSFKIFLGLCIVIGLVGIGLVTSGVILAMPILWGFGIFALALVTLLPLASLDD